jgi:hypothetical protein
MRLTTQAEAVFASSLQPSDHPTANEVISAARRSLQINGGVSGCIAAFAAEYGEHPEASANRMRWVLSLVAGVATATAA